MVSWSVLQNRQTTECHRHTKVLSETTIDASETHAMSTLTEIHVLEGKEFIDLLMAANLSIDHIDDLQRNSSNTVIGLMTVFEGDLGIEPPSAAAIHALMAAMTEDSSLADDLQIPERSSYALGDQQKYFTPPSTAT